MRNLCRKKCLSVKVSISGQKVLVFLTKFSYKTFLYPSWICFWSSTCITKLCQTNIQYFLLNDSIAFVPCSLGYFLFRSFCFENTNFFESNALSILLFGLILFSLFFRHSGHVLDRIPVYFSLWCSCFLRDLKTPREKTVVTEGWTYWRNDVFYRVT